MSKSQDRILSHPVFPEVTHSSRAPGRVGEFWPTLQSALSAGPTFEPHLSVHLSA